MNKPKYISPTPKKISIPSKYSYFGIDYSKYSYFCGWCGSINKNCYCDVTIKDLK